MGPAMMGQQATMPATGPASTDPAALVQQFVAMATNDQQALEMQQQMQMAELAEAQKAAMIQALQGMIQGLGGAAHAPGGAEAAVPPAEDYAGMAPELPMDALAQLPQPGMGGRGQGPIIQPDEIPPEFG